MAIIIEEKKRGTNLIRLGGWVGILVIVGIAIYYVFFAAPELVNIAAPPGLQNIAPLSQITLHPQDVLNSPAFQALKPPSFSLPSPQGPTAVGRSNPFIAP